MSLEVSVGGNMAGWQQTLAKARVEGRKFADEMAKEAGNSWKEALSPSKLAAGAGAFFGFEALKGHLEGLLSKGKEISELAEQFEMSTDSVQKWEKAVGKAGVSFSIFTRAVDSLRTKRQAARQDDNALAPFTRIGISPEEVRGNMSDEDLLKRVLGSDASRALIDDLVGARGVRLQAALPFLGSAKPSMSSEDVAALRSVEEQKNEAQRTLTKASLTFGPGRAMIALGQILSGKFEEAGASFRNAFSFGGYQKLKDLQARNEQPEPGTPPPIEEDPQLALQKKLREASIEKQIADEQLRQLDFTNKMAEEQRKTMGYGERRLSIQKEMQRIADMDQAIQNASPELREALRARRDENALKYQALANELHEKPGTFAPDALARIGLFTGASISVNPVVGVQQKQLEVLQSIDRKLGVTGSPFDP